MPKTGKRGRGGSNKWGGGWKISENFNKQGFKINGGGWESSDQFNLTKQRSHNMTGCACCGIRFLAGNFVPKMHTCKCIKVLARYLLILLWPVIHYQT